MTFKRVRLPNGHKALLREGINCMEYDNAIDFMLHITILLTKSDNLFWVIILKLTKIDPFAPNSGSLLSSLWWPNTKLLASF